ncbi:peroxisomal membrane protein 11B [Neocloeon triangulifer]|uniref:peroxisomal membrane protein 11B n=1 Tax=Neocloeon triangulifer TaxID=2078957 RepID=UPI00286EE9B3|nr:peroxisomal membrane protein 11B [Neocloeon triangulifer]
MEALIRLNNQTAGRDKIARLLQYLSRALWALLEGRPRAVHKLQGLENALSTFRKLLRWGRCVEAVHSALQAMSHPDAAQRTILALGRIAHALFLFADHILWLGRAGLAKVDAKKWASIANRYWLYSVTMNLVRDLMALREAKERKGSISGEGPWIVDTVKNSCDFFIPLTALEHIRLGPATIGLLGVVSSLAGLLPMLHPQLKL